MCEKRAQKRIFVSEREDLKGGRTKMRDLDPQFDSSQNIIIRMIK
jgi:hypothetical protein